MRVAVLFSGGKDSCYTVWVLQHQGWEIAKLVTVKPGSPDSWMFHYPNVDWTGLQAQAMGLQHELVSSSGDEMETLEKALAKIKEEDGIQGVATGAVASDYQRARFDRMCDSIGLKSFSPLWHKKPEVIINDLTQAGFLILMSGVAAAGLDKSWLGKTLTHSEWAELKQLSRRHGIHLSGEGGEYETFVTDGPHFSKRVAVEKTKSVFAGESGYLVIEKASLRDKLGN